MEKNSKWQSGVLYSRIIPNEKKTTDTSPAQKVFTLSSFNNDKNCFVWNEITKRKKMHHFKIVSGIERKPIRSDLTDS